MDANGNRGGRPDVSDEDIGRRTVEIRREKALERALELIRKRLGPEWTDLSTDDLERLHWTLGEVWSHMSRVGWEAISFSALTVEDIQGLLDLSAELKAATYGTSNILDRMVAVLNNPGRIAADNAAAAAAAAEAEESAK